jgi:hypothetical protein
MCQTIEGRKLQSQNVINMGQRNFFGHKPRIPEQGTPRNPAPASNPLELVRVSKTLRSLRCKRRNDARHVHLSKNADCVCPILLVCLRNACTMLPHGRLLDLRGVLEDRLFLQIGYYRSHDHGRMPRQYPAVLGSAPTYEHGGVPDLRRWIYLLGQ